MDFENNQNKIENSSQEQKIKNRENLRIPDIINEGEKQFYDVVERNNNENKQVISSVENYSGVELEDIKVAQEIVAETNNKINQIIENANSEVSEINSKQENISPELKAEIDKLKFLQEEEMRLQKRYEDLEKEYKENFQIVSKKELSWYESEMNSVYSKLDNMRYSIPSLEKKIETLKNPVIEPEEQKNIEKKDLTANESDAESISKNKNKHKFRDFLLKKEYDVISVENNESNTVKKNDSNSEEASQVKEDSEKSVGDIVGENHEVNQEKYKKIYDILTSQITGYGDEKAKQSILENVKHNFNLLDDKSIQEVNKEVTRLKNDGSYIDASKILDEAIRGYKSREIYNLKKGMTQGLSAGEKFSFIEKKINELDDNGQLHGISARQLTSLFKQVLKGEKTITDLKENSFTLGKNKITLSLDSLAEDLLLHDIVTPNMGTLKRVAKSLDLSKSYMDEIEKIEKGEYVRPEGDYGVLIEKANEIMGLKKPGQKHNPDSQWTDRNNPPTRWDKNAKVGDKIRK